MKLKPKPLDNSLRDFDAKQFWRHYVATVDADHVAWNQERQKGGGSNRIFLFLLLFHVFLIASVVLFNLVSDRPKPVFVDSTAPVKKPAASTKKTTAPDKAPAAPVIAVTKNEGMAEHRVGQGDSLKSIADKAGTTQEEIARLNEIDVNTQLAVGSVLRVPKPKEAPAPAAPALQPARVRESVIAVQATTTPGSTEMFRAVEPTQAPAPKPAVIASKPPEDKPKPKIEDTPPAKPKATETKAVVKSEPPKPTAKPAEPAKPAVSGVTHTVKPKETFYSISRKYGVKAEDLMRVNGFTDAGKLRDGVVLKVPGK